MKKVRYRVAVLASWLILLLVFDQLLDPFILSSTSLILIFATVITGLILSKKKAVFLWGIFIIPVMTLFFVELRSTGVTGNERFLYISIEGILLTGATAFAVWVSGALNELDTYLVSFSLRKPEKEQKKDPAALGSIYREVRRARNHQRPLALLSISVSNHSLNRTVDKTSQETQLSILKQDKLQGLSQMLCDQLEDCAVIVRDSDRFLAVLPETTPAELPVVIDRLRQKAGSQVNVELKIGAAALPDDSYTFEGLVDAATMKMETDQAPEPRVLMDPIIDPAAVQHEIH